MVGAINATKYGIGVKSNWGQKTYFRWKAEGRVSEEERRRWDQKVKEMFGRSSGRRAKTKGLSPTRTG